VPLDLAEEVLCDVALLGAAPHLPARERGELRDAYLGDLTWEQATAAVSS
jgi:hypothetical protein